MNAPEGFEEGREVQSMSVESGTVALLNKSEIDMQIATAHKYPRSIKRFRNNVQDMVTISEAVAQECIYAIPRDGKVIEGPSARFAEVVASAWGNSRAGARVVSDQGDFVTAQGVFHDLEQNVAITYEVQRRITNKAGKRFSPDMIGVTANAACSIALRNAILKGIPKAFWSDMYSGARQCAMGDVKTLPTRRAEAFKMFQGYGITKEQVFAKLNIPGEEDIGQEELVVLRGLLTAIKEGDTTPEQAFADLAPASSGPKPKSEKKPDSAPEAPRAQEQQAAPGKHYGNQTAPNGDDQPIKPASESQIKFIRSKAEQAAITESEILKRFSIEQLDGINIKQVDEILSFIANPTGA